MHRLVEPQALHVGPRQRLEQAALARHLGRPHQRLEGDVLGAALRLDALEHFGQRHADPGDHHRPAFHAAHAVDALLELGGLDQVVEVVVGRLADEAVDLDRPGLGLERVRVLGGIALVGAELVEVVVAGDVLEGRQRLVGGGERALGRLQRGSLGACSGKGRRQAGAEPQCGSAGEELPAAQIHLARCDLGWCDVGRASDQHVSEPRSCAESRNRDAARAAEGENHAPDGDVTRSDGCGAAAAVGRNSKAYCAAHRKIGAIRLTPICALRLRRRRARCRRSLRSSSARPGAACS